MLTPFSRSVGCILVFCLWAAAAGAGQVTVFAAASLKNALDEIAEGFEAQSSHNVDISFAGSSVLARQIQQGAPANIFISANIGWMDVLEQQGLIDAKSRFDLAGNTLVLIGHGAGHAPLAPQTLPDQLGSDRLAMALVQAVPAGQYGKAALTSLGLWDRLAPQIAQTDNVRTALALVAAGAAPFGIVYGTDAAASGEVSILATFPAGSHPVILYPAATVTSRGTDASDAFLDHLNSDEARRILRRHGFPAPVAG